MLDVWLLTNFMHVNSIYSVFYANVITVATVKLCKLH